MSFLKSVPASMNVSRIIQHQCYHNLVYTAVLNFLLRDPE